MAHNVLNRPGQKFLTSSTVDFLRHKNLQVQNVVVEQASGLARNLIEATALTAAFLPAPSGIGGPIDVYLLGTDPKATKL